MFRRIGNIFRAIFSSGVGKVEESRYKELLDLSYEQLLNMLASVDKSLADAAQGKARTQQLVTANRKEADKYEGLARKFLEAADEASATQALQSKAFVDEQLTSLQQDLDHVTNQLADLTATRGQLEVQIKAVGANNERTKVRIAVGKATVGVAETVTGISKQAGDLARTTARLNGYADQLEARGNGIAELIATGGLTNILDPDSTPLDRAGLELTRKASVTADLARLKKEIGPGSPSPETADVAS